MTPRDGALFQVSCIILLGKLCLNNREQSRSWLVGALASPVGAPVSLLDDANPGRSWLEIAFSHTLNGGFA